MDSCIQATSSYLAYSKECTQRSLEVIRKCEENQKECADLLIMNQYALEDEAALLLRFKGFVTEYFCAG